MVDSDPNPLGCTAFRFSHWLQALLLLIILTPTEGHAQSLVKLLANHGAGDESFGHAVSLSGELSTIGAPSADVHGITDAGAIYLFLRSGDTWIEMVKLSAPNPRHSDRCGSAVSSTRDRVFMACPGTGIVHVFSHADEIWRWEASIQPQRNEFNGPIDVSIDSDGDRVAVGTGGQSIYIFDLKEGGSWQQTAVIEPQGSMDFSSFAIDGDHLAAAGRLSAGDITSSIFPYEYANDEWIPMPVLTGVNNWNARFGDYVDISGDTLVTNSGWAQLENGVDVFLWSDSLWTKRSELRVESEGYLFPVSIGSGIIVIGDPHASEDGTDRGAYAFIRRNSGWSQAFELATSNRSPDDLMGRSIATSDGRVIIGAPGDDAMGTDAGAAYVFRMTNDGFELESTLTASDALDDGGLNTDIWFARSLAVHDNKAVIGTMSGSSYFFHRSGSTWSQVDRLQVEQLLPGEERQVAVAVHDETAVLGASETHVAEWDGNEWKKTTIFPMMGSAVATDGERILIWDTDADEAIHVYRREGPSWEEEAEINFPEYQRFVGTPGSVDIQRERLVFSVNNPIIVDGFIRRTEHLVYTFVRDGSIWNPADTLRWDGYAIWAPVDMEGDRLIVGGPRGASTFHWGSSGWQLENVLSEANAWSVAFADGVSVVGHRTLDSTWVGIYPIGDTDAMEMLTSPASYDDQFGWSIGANQTTLFIGAPKDGDNGNRAGAVYLYDLSHVTLATEYTEGQERHRSLQNYPNPFRETTIIPVHVNAAQSVTVTVYDLVGRKIDTIFDGYLSPGVRNLTWAAGPTAAGVYVCVVEAGSIRYSLLMTRTGGD